MLPYYKQLNEYYCGPAVAQMALEFFGIRASQHSIARHANTSEHSGTANSMLPRVLRRYGTRCRVRRNGSLADLRHWALTGLPVIISYVEPIDNLGHYALVSNITKNRIYLHDPMWGKQFSLSLPQFSRRWQNGTGYWKRWFVVVEKR